MNIRIVKNNETLAEIFSVKSIEIPVVEERILIDGKKYEVLKVTRTFENIKTMLEFMGVEETHPGHLTWFIVTVE